MKKLLYLAAAFAFTALAACSDANEEVDRLIDEIDNRPMAKQFDYTLTDADYTTISEAAKKDASNDEEKKLAENAGSSKTLNSFANSVEYVPSLLATAYPGLGHGSAVMVTYNYTTGEVLEDLSYLSGAPTYTLKAADYASVWGDDSETAFLTPANSPAKVLPAILKTAVPDAQNGDIRVVNYKYANQEPPVVIPPGDGDPEPPVTVGVPFFEDFEGYAPVATSFPYTWWDKNDWKQIFVQGDESKYWQVRSYNNNLYGQVSANGGVDETTEVYMVSPLIDLSKTKGNVFSFDVCVGYFNYNGLKVLITEDVKALTAPDEVTWDDVTANFTIPQEPTSGYGVISPAGSMELDTKYAGKKIFIAFRYYGEKGTGNTWTTTYQIDNVLVATETLLDENFEGYAPIASSFPYTWWDKNGWEQIFVQGDESKYWQVRSYNNNLYGQVSANGGVDETTEVYMVSPALSLTHTTDNVFSFSVTVGYFNYNGLKVLITEDAKALTAPDEVSWDDVTANFTIPQEPTSGYGTISPAGSMDLDADYAGKTIYIAFRYYGEKGTGNTWTTTYQIDDILVKGTIGAPVMANVFASMAVAQAAAELPETPTVTENAIYIFDGSAWAPYTEAAIVNPADYEAMGVTSLTSDTAPLYLPAFLAQKFPYAQAGDAKAVRYGTSAAKYIFDGTVWAPDVVETETLTEQFLIGENGEWLFDPTVNYAMTGPDNQLVIDWMMSKPEWVVYVNMNPSRMNEEFYYGFSAYYNNANFRLSYRTDGASGELSAHDTEYHSLPNDPQVRLDFLWNRLEQEGIPLFLQLKFPLAVADVQGLPVYYNINVGVHSPDDGLTNITKYYIFSYKTLTSGTASTPPTFEFLETTPVATEE